MSTVDVQIVEAQSAQDFTQIRRLFEEYAGTLSGVDLAFQGFAEELRDLPGKYAAPSGCVLLAQCGDQIAGCIALRPLDAGVCEMKRLYVRPAYRQHKLGRLLASALIDRARSIGHRSMRLDTIPTMVAAIALYESLGFVGIDSYYSTPIPETIFMELNLL